ncbi:MAG: energy transducer TonB [Cyclobacteriaceae bacterium]|nr:energy transducer TonB [Cyclobacteriaceae bacterium HetDA_MAG_MS6]
MKALMTAFLFSTVFITHGQHQSSLASTSNQLAFNTSDSQASISQQASYPGGTNAFYHHLKNELTYPEEVRRQCKEGSVVVSFLISKEGSLQDFEIVQSLGEPFDNEALRVLKKMPQWIPRVRNGVPVAQRWIQPIKFTFPD